MKELSGLAAALAKLAELEDIQGGNSTLTPLLPGGGNTCTKSSACVQGTHNNSKYYKYNFRHAPRTLFTENGTIFEY